MSNSTGWVDIRKAGHFLHFQCDVAVNQVIGEHIACLEEFPVLVERFQGLVEGMADRAADRALLPAAGSYRSLSIGAPGSILLMTPSRPAIIIAAKVR